jgi:hypothetical protein
MSSIAAVPVSAYTWPADVLALASREKVTAYLQPLLDATRQLFPLAEIKVFSECDVSLPEEYIVFEVHVPLADPSEHLAADSKWRQEISRICPGPLHTAFAFSLRGRYREP